MICPDCKHANTPERNYCGACGEGLARYCRGCGFRNGAADRYCGGCGVVLGEGVPAHRPAAAPRPGATPVAAPAGAAAAADPLTAELLAVAAEALVHPTGEADPKVSQDDIDSLFGD